MHGRKKFRAHRNLICVLAACVQHMDVPSMHTIVDFHSVVGTCHCQYRPSHPNVNCLKSTVDGIEKTLWTWYSCVVYWKSEQNTTTTNFALSFISSPSFCSVIFLPLLSSCLIHQQDLTGTKNSNFCSHRRPGNSYFISVRQVSLPVNFRYFAT